jgi:hypothetical protein
MAMDANIYNRVAVSISWENHKMTWMSFWTLKDLKDVRASPNMVAYIRRPMDYTDIYTTISTTNNNMEILLEHQQMQSYVEN